LLQGIAVGEMSFLLAVFAVIEHLTKSELTTTSKKLLIAYLNDTSPASYADRAREAVRRYAQAVLPTLDHIREKSRTVELDELDHLVLKLEYEAARLSRAAPSRSPSSKTRRGGPRP